MESADLSFGILPELTKGSTIATRYSACASAFSRAVQLCSASKASELDNQVSATAIQDEFGRFRVWAGNIGAHRIGKVSLDHRLREATHMRKRVTDLLDELRTNLEELSDILSGKRPPYDEQSDESSSSDSGTDSESDEFLQGNIEDTSHSSRTEIEQRLFDINDIICCLYRLSVAFRNPAPTDRLAKSAQIDVSHFAAWDIRHVGEKFPLANPTIIQRLGEANSRRRQLLRYMEKHHAKLSRNVSNLPAMDEKPASSEHTALVNIPPVLAVQTEDDEARKNIDSQSQPATVRTTPSALATTVNTQTTVATFVERDPDLDADDAVSETSSATSASANDDGALRLPSPPRGALEGEPFECFLCYDMITIKSMLSWKRHVFRDLQPYICTFTDCSRPNRMYHSRHTWINHETQMHRRQWICAICQRVMITKSELKSHLMETHPDTFAEHQVEVLVDMCERPVPMANLQTCPLCLLENQKLSTHLARHLQNVALFTLPRKDSDSENDMASNDARVWGTDDDEDEEQRMEEVGDVESVTDVSLTVLEEIPDAVDLEADSFRDEIEKDTQASSHAAERPVEGGMVDSLSKSERTTLQKALNEVITTIVNIRVPARDLVETAEGSAPTRSIIGPFLSLPSKEKYPEYYQLIQEPISIDIISNKIRDYEYKRLRELEADLMLLVRNAKNYNRHGSTVYADAITVERISHEAIAKQLSEEVGVETLQDIPKDEVSGTSATVPDLRETRKSVAFLTDKENSDRTQEHSSGEYSGVPDTRNLPGDESAKSDPSASMNQPIVYLVRALYDFVPSEVGELAFRKGDVIEVLESLYDEWWKGLLRGKTGFFPLNYVEKLDGYTFDITTKVDPSKGIYDGNRSRLRLIQQYNRQIEAINKRLDQSYNDGASQEVMANVERDLWSRLDPFHQLMHDQGLHLDAARSREGFRNYPDDSELFSLAKAPPKRQRWTELRSKVRKITAIFDQLIDTPDGALPHLNEQQINLDLERHTINLDNEREALIWAEKALNWAELARLQIQRSQYKATAAFDFPDALLMIETDACNIVNFMAEKQSPKALFLKGLSLEFGKFGHQVDKQKAWKYYRLASKGGYSRSEYRSGMMFESSNDPASAMHYYQSSASDEDAAALYRLGMVKTLGQHGAERDEAAGLAMIARSAAKADLNAPGGAYVLGMLQIGTLQEQLNISPSNFLLNIEEGKANIEKAARLGFAKAQLQLGTMYEMAEHGMEFDPARSVHYYHHAACQGDSEAEMGVSKWFLCGHEGLFNKDDKIAWEYASRAASSGLANAEFALGYFSEIGIYVRANAELAKSWYRKAADQGHEDAIQRLRALEGAEVFQETSRPLAMPAADYSRLNYGVRLDATEDVTSKLSRDDKHGYPLSPTGETSLPYPENYPIAYPRTRFSDREEQADTQYESDDSRGSSARISVPTNTRRLSKETKKNTSTGGIRQRLRNLAWGSKG